MIPGEVGCHSDHGIEARLQASYSRGQTRAHLENRHLPPGMHEKSLNRFVRHHRLPKMMWEISDTQGPFWIWSVKCRECTQSSLLFSFELERVRFPVICTLVIVQTFFLHCAFTTLSPHTIRLPHHKHVPHFTRTQSIKNQAKKSDVVLGAI